MKSTWNHVIVKMKLHNGYRMGLFLLIFTQVLSWNGTNAENTIVVSQSVSVQEGLCVTIPCSFTANDKNKFTNTTGLWISDKNVTVASNNPSYPGKKNNFLLTGDSNSGSCILTITGAKKEDSGKYFYRFKETPSSQVDYKNSIVSVQVTDLKEKPKIKVPKELIAGQDASLQCVPTGNCPAKSYTVKWRKSNVGGTWIKSSQLTFTPTLYDHQASVFCDVTLSTGKITTAQHVLNIEYPPANMHIIVSSSTGRSIDVNDYIVISKEEVLLLNCSVEANPPATVTWRKRNDINHIYSITSGMFWSAVNITEADIYSCSASNKFGINETYLEIEIITKEDFQRTPDVRISTYNGSSLSGSSILNRGDLLTLVCVVSSYLPSSAIWLSEDVVLEHSHGKSLHLNVTIPGTYTCIASNQLGARTASIRIFLEDESYGITCCDCEFLTYNVIIWMASGNVVVLLLTALGLYCCITRRMKKKQLLRKGSNVYELTDQKKPEPIYTDLRGQRNSIYHTVK